MARRSTSPSRGRRGVGEAPAPPAAVVRCGRLGRPANDNRSGDREWTTVAGVGAALGLALAAAGLLAG